MSAAPEITVLIGKQLSIARHAADMLGLHFGKISRAGSKSWAELALHVQCPWRLRREGKIIVGYEDYWHSQNGDLIANRNEWCKNTHPSLEDDAWLALLGKRDELTRSFENDNRDLLVLGASVNTCGDLNLRFKDGLVFETFGHGTTIEFWRLFESNVENDHLVIGCEHVS